MQFVSLDFVQHIKICHLKNIKSTLKINNNASQVKKSTKMSS